MLITVIGLGRLGLVHAAVMAKLGHQVIAIEAIADRVEKLKAGVVPFFEPGLEELFAEVMAEGKISFHSEHTAESKNAQLHFICVGTPQSESGEQADTSYVFDAATKLAPFMSPQSVVVGKSTVPIGTSRGVSDLLESLTGSKRHVVWNPEFLREGHAVADTMRPDRIVLGSESKDAEALVLESYKKIIDLGVPVVSCDFQTAELVKVSANAFLATKISFINAVAEVAENTGANTELIAEALGLDDRIGRKFLNNGLGYGGGCLPKDSRSMKHIAEQVGAPGLANLLSSVEAINVGRKERIIELAKQQLGDLTGKRVAVLGAAFKPNTDDIRDSPAIDIAQRFHDAGASVVVQDEMAIENVVRELPHFDAVVSPDEALAQADLVVIATEWRSYTQIDPSEAGKLVSHKNLILARKVVDEKLWQGHGWNVKALGRS